MNVDLSLVNALSSEILVHDLLRDPLIIEIRVFRNIESINLSGNNLQERRTTTGFVRNLPRVVSWHYSPPRPPQYHKHLSTPDQAFKIPQDLDPGLSPIPDKSLGQID